MNRATILSHLYRLKKKFPDLIDMDYINKLSDDELLQLLNCCTEMYDSSNKSDPDNRDSNRYTRQTDVMNGSRVDADIEYLPQTTVLSALAPKKTRRTADNFKKKKK